MLNGSKHTKAEYKFKIQQYNGGKYASQIILMANNEEKILLEFTSDGLPAIAIYTLSGQIANIETIINQLEKKPENTVKSIKVPRV